MIVTRTGQLLLLSIQDAMLGIQLDSPALRGTSWMVPPPLYVDWIAPGGLCYPHVQVYLFNYLFIDIYRYLFQLEIHYIGIDGLLHLKCHCTYALYIIYYFTYNYTFNYCRAFTILNV